MLTNKEYHSFLKEILQNGVEKLPSRKQDVGTIEAFGSTTPMRFDLSKGLPVVSTKKIWVKGIVEELLWFMRGETNIRSLRAAGVHIWDDNAYEYFHRIRPNIEPIPKDKFFLCVDLGIPAYGELGRMYGYQWRTKKVVDINDNIITTDPLMDVINTLIKTPNSRQIVLDTFSAYDASVSALPPCHSMPLILNTVLLTDSERKVIAEELTQERVYDYNPQLFEDLKIPKYKLNAEMIQRSGDAFLGVPFNISSTSLLILILSKHVNMHPGTFTHVVANAHIYLNHLDQVKEQLTRNEAINSYFPYEIIENPNSIVPLSINIEYNTFNSTIKAQMVT